MADGSHKNLRDSVRVSDGWHGEVSTGALAASGVRRVPGGASAGFGDGWLRRVYFQFERWLTGHAKRSCCNQCHGHIGRDNRNHGRERDCTIGLTVWWDRIGYEAICEHGE